MKFKETKFVLKAPNETEIASNYFKEKYSAAETILAIRRFHQFIPVSQVIIKTKHISQDKKFCYEFNLTKEPQICLDTL